jgi:hypothetical protein
MSFCFSVSERGLPGVAVRRIAGRNHDGAKGPLPRPTPALGANDAERGSLETQRGADRGDLQVSGGRGRGRGGKVREVHWVRTVLVLSLYKNLRIVLR